MITIYSNTITGRLSYILQLIFNDLIGIEFELTSDSEKFRQRSGPKIAYANERTGDELLICPSGLVYEKEIKPQVLEITEWEGLKIFFRNSATADLPFDIFSASFLMVSRYKEYLPYQKGEIQRFEATESLAFRYGFLEEPVINQWSVKLKEVIQKRYPEVRFPGRKFQFISTIDIDNAFAFKHKSFVRTVGALLRSLLRRDTNTFLSRIATLLGNDEDPYNTYGFIDQVEKRNGLRSMFFFLVGDYNRYDTNISVRSMAYRNLIKNIAADHKIGIHPSVASHKNISILQKEVNRLAGVLGERVTKSRQHFLAFELPTTYLRLIQLGILEDYSMGYASHIGFRAGICSPFRFYNLSEEKETDLVVYPFQVMDVTLMQYLRLSPDEAIEKIGELMDKVKKVDGTFISLWHNESLSDKGVWQGWRKVFEEVVRMGNADPERSKPVSLFSR
jgi:Family of unknown function (DUF7033)